MRKLFTFLCAAMMLPAAAQWTPGDNSLSPIDTEGGIEREEPKMVRKADGTTFMAYRSYGVHVNPETGVQDTAKFFYLHLQKLDANGNKQWGDSGIIVSSKPTDLASFGHVNLDTLSNGNLIMTHEDIREIEQGGGELTHTNIRNIKTIAYCYDQQGNPVWSEDGVMMPYHIIDTAAVATIYAGEEIAVSGDNIYLASVILVQYTRPDPQTLQPVDTYVHYFEAACYDYNGNKIGERLDSVTSAFTFSLVPAPDGDAYLVYVNDHDGYSAQRLGSDCQFKWNNAPILETQTVVEREQTGVFAIPPYAVFPISDGSIGVIYKAFTTIVWSALYYNRVYPDGTVLENHVNLSDTTGVHGAFAMMIEGDTLTIFETYEHNRTQLGEYYLYLNQIKLDGTHLLPNIYGYWLDERMALDAKPLCIVKADENYNVIVYDKDYYANLIYQSHCYTISPDGKLFQRKPVLDNTHLNDVDCIVENNYAYIAFSRGEFGKAGVWISCIDATDYTNSVELTGELSGKFTVGPDGKQVNFSRGNLTYLPYRQTYKFATSQYETHHGFNQWITETSMDWMDLFGWGTGDHASKVSTDNADYATYTDWGNNVILNSTYPAGTWRAMSADEWDYLLNRRENAAQKRAIGQIDFAAYYPVHGLFILPDTFEMPQGLQMDMDAHEYTINSYLINVWYKLEEAGVVFIPEGGYRNGTDVYEYDHMGERGLGGHYWTATPLDAENAKEMIISLEGPSFNLHPRAYGFNVRLVKDAESEQGIEDIKVTNDNQTRKIMMNGQLYIIRNGKVYSVTGAEVK